MTDTTPAALFCDECGSSAEPGDLTLVWDETISPPANRHLCVACIMAPASTPISEVTDWRAAITALCGGDDLGAMHRWLVPKVAEGWRWYTSIEDENVAPPYYAGVYIEDGYPRAAETQALPEVVADTEEEALARAILAAVASGEGG